MSKYYIGIDVGGTKIAYGIFDEKQEMIRKYKFPTYANAEASEFADSIISRVFDILKKENISTCLVGGVGIAFPSFINHDKGLIVRTVNIKKLKNFPAKEYFTRKMNMHVVIENDGNAAALAEHRKGAGRGHKHMLYCPVSTGISSAIIIDGKIFRGSYGWAGESGHSLIIPDEGPYCGCENQGCFMSHISGSMIIKRIIVQIEAGEYTTMMELCGNDTTKLNAEHLLSAYNLKDALACNAVEHMGRYMGIWLFNLYQILNINCFVFGGGLTNFGDLLFDKALSVFYEYEHSDLPIDFKFAELGENSGIIGAVLVLMNNLD